MLLSDLPKDRLALGLAVKSLATGHEGSIVALHFCNSKCLHHDEYHDMCVIHVQWFDHDNDSHFPQCDFKGVEVI